MENKGISVNWSDARKHITFTDTEGHRVRAAILGKTFNIDYLKSKETFEMKIIYKDVINEKRDVSLPEIDIPSIRNSVGLIADVVVKQIRTTKEQESQRAQHI